MSKLWLALSVIAAAGMSMTATASAQPTDDQLLFDDFESATLANWRATVTGAGLAEVQATQGFDGSRGARLTVPTYGTDSIAYIQHALAIAQRGISASGRFRAISGGCAGDATYSNGNLPFLRLFDSDGRRVAGVYRINANCGKTTKLYVQHSGNFYRTGKNITLGAWNHVELRLSVAEPGSSLVQVYVNGALIYESTTADNGTKPIARINIHNEHVDQVGDLAADDVQIARFDVAAPTDACDPTAPAPTSGDPGTTVLADNFETSGFPMWSAVTRLGDASVNLQPQTVHAGRCAGLVHVTSSTGSKGNLIRTLPSATSELWADGWFNVVRPGDSATSNVPLLRLFTASSRLVDVYRLNDGGALYLRSPNGAGGFAYTPLGRTLAPGAWYHLKLHTVAAGDASRIEVWLDGQLLESITAPLGTSVLEQAMVGSEHFAQDGDLAVDDVVLTRVP